MTYYKYLYLEEGLEKKRDKMIDKLERNKLQFGVFLIVLSQNGNNHLELLDSKLLLQKDYPKEDYFVVGIAKDQTGAIEIVEEILQEVYNETKGADIRSYILKKEREG